MEDIVPDWVCEICSPGHIADDSVKKLNLLQLFQVPYYWIIYPEEKTITVYQYMDDAYKVITSLQNPGKCTLQPFTEIEFDFDYIFNQ